MSIKNKRQISKEVTKEIILKGTKKLIIKNGILNTTTKEISAFCNVAHGTIFSHFSNREALISEVLKTELMGLAKVLHQLKDNTQSIAELLDEYLNLVERNELFLTVISKEFSFLSRNLQREIIITESIVKKMFYAEIEKLISSKNMDIQVAVSFLFGTINYYLNRKEYIVLSGSVMKVRKIEIKNTFLDFLK
jgi:AcrR family transcriptional regulator